MSVKDKNESPQETHEQESSQQDHPPVSKSKRMRRIVVAGLLGLVVLIAIAPNLIGWTGSVNRLANSFVDLNGELHVSSASLGWFQKITLHDVQLKDKAGGVIFKAGSVQSSKSLLALIMHQDQLGEFQINDADVALITWPGGSNLEEVLEPLMAPADNKPSAASVTPQITINIANSRISLRREDDENWVDLLNTNGQVQIIPQSNQIAINVQAEAPNSGNIDANAQLDIDFANESSMQGANGQLALTAFDCSLLSPVFYRLDQNIAVSGKLNSRLKGSWASAGDAQLDIEQLRGNAITIDAPDYLNAEPIKIKNLIATGIVGVNGLAVTAKQLALKSEFAVLDANGTFDVAELVAAISGQGQLTHDFQVNGQIDVAALTSVAPGFMDVRDDVELQEARIDCEAFCRMENGQRRLLVNLELPTITARRFRVAEARGQRRVLKNQSETIEWKSPIRLTAAARQDNTPLWLELLSCQSEFLVANGGTQPNGQGQLVAQGDLDKLKSLLEQFFDLSHTQLAGRLAAQVDWDRLSGDALGQNINRPARMSRAGKKLSAPADNTIYLLSGNCSVDKFAYGNSDESSIHEDQLVLKFDSNYAFQDIKGNSLQSARLEITSGADQANVTLARPVLNPGFDSEILADVAVKGTLPNWMRRMRVFAAVPNMNLQGELDAAGLLTYTPQSVAFASQRLQVTEFAYLSKDVRIREPQFVANTNMKYDFDSQRLTSKATTLTGSAISMRADDMVVDLSGKPEFFQSALSVSADLQRAMGWFDKAGQPTPYRGKVTGKIDLLMNRAGLEATIDSSVEDFKYVSVSSVPKGNAAKDNGLKREVSTLWAEKKFTVGGQAEYKFTSDSVVIKSIRLRGDGLAADGSGRINDLTSVCRINLAGTLQTDADRIVTRFRDIYGIDLQMSGKDEGKFVVRGPLFETTDAAASTVAANSPKQADDKNLFARAQVNWQSGSVYGLPFGQGKLGVRADSQQLDFDPINLPLSSGKLVFDPAILFGEQYLLTVKADKIVSRAELTPQICREWLKYVNPFLAEATEARGKFSADLKKEAVMPLSNPLGGSIDGDITLHSAKVGPGPLGRQIIAIAEQVRAIAKGKPLGETLLAAAAGSQNNSQIVLLEMPEQTVNCQVKDGRVHHNQMTFQIKDVIVQTSGSIGADETIDIVAKIQYTGDTKLPAGLAGNAIQIPIKGTIGRPSIGKEVLAALPKLLLKNATSELIKDKSGQFLKDAAGKLIDEKTGNLLKGKDNPANKTANPLEDAAGKLLEDQLRGGLEKLIGSPKKK